MNRHTYARITGVIIFLGLLCGLAARPALAATTALRVGHLIDPATGAAATNQVILVKDGKITEVGPGVKIPAGAEVIDLSRSWVMPGLMDAHTHITVGSFDLTAGIEAGYLKQSSAARALIGLRNAQDVLRAGFTTIRDVGNEANFASVDLRDAINRGLFDGPTLLTTGKIIAPFGGQSMRISPEQGRFWLYEYIDADTPDEIRKAVRQVIFYGADAVKLVADNSPFYYSLAEIQAAVSEGHAAGRAVSVHIFAGGEPARNVILGGADSIEHGMLLEDDLLALMKEKGTALVSTDFPEAHLAALDPNGLYFGSAKEFAGMIIDRLKRAHRIGVMLVFGTDTVKNLPGKIKPEMMLDYLAVWQAAGIPAADTLKAMTTNAAKLLRIDKVRGAIAAGFAADLIAMPANPLDDVQALRRVSFVMKDGKVIRNDR
jgi:imidazolonepropionase-like amidohydrolase